MKKARATRGAGETGLQQDHRPHTARPATSSTSPFAGRWPSELLAEVASAPSRRVAGELFRLSQGAVDGLPDGARERLLTAVQDILAELPDGDARRRGQPFVVARRRQIHG